MAPRPTRPARTNEAVSKSTGRSTTQSRQQAGSNAERTAKQRSDVAPLTAADGYPLVKISMAASELIPTGQFANISVGPAVIEWYIDPREDEPISKEELEVAAKAFNTLAELVEVDVIAVQRNIVLESMQSQVSND